MTIYAGSMLAEVQRLQGLGYTVGVVVVDEQGDGGYEETYDQQAVLMFASRNGCPVWLVELNPNAGNEPNLKTRVRLRALLPPGTPVVTKTSLNAFVGTNLDHQLTAHHVSAFVIMGFAVNCCVRQTAVGGPEKRVGPHVHGATDHGYVVMSCPQILRGGQANEGGTAIWRHEPGVWFFNSV